MKLKLRNLVPLMLCGAVAGLVALLHAITHHFERLDFTRRLEWMTFDWRVRYTQDFPQAHAPNLGFVYINDETIERVLGGGFGYTNGLYWPRHVYGRIVQELAHQGAEAIAFDVLFPELRPDHPPVVLPNGSTEPSDSYFARELRAAGNVILGSADGAVSTNYSAVPPDYFRTNAWAIGDISAQQDNDGILRRAKPFRDYILWHAAIKRLQRSRDGFEATTNQIAFPGPGNSRTLIPIAADAIFDLTTLQELESGRKATSNLRRLDYAFTRVRGWDLGIALAARHLQLDLENALIEPGRRIVLRGTNGTERIIPIDKDGNFHIDWSLRFKDPRLTYESAHSLLFQQRQREIGATDALTNQWRNKLVLIGSVASGNDLHDKGATPLERETLITSRYWNVANSLIMDRFIRQPGFLAELGIIICLSLVAGVITWKLRALVAGICMLCLGAGYVAGSIYLYVEVRYWVPLVTPLVALVLTHFTLISYRAVVEQRERRRIRNIFSKIVSPNVVHELLEAEKLALGGTQREITVLFSDVRGFTEMTDESHARAEEFVREHKLGDHEAQTFLDEQAQEVLRTVNLYLGTIADTVKQREGTLDKYIGDCVMAFWGAPTPNEKHALSCVRAAIDAQRAIHVLNQGRVAENQRREQENLRRAPQAQPALPLLKLLAMGTGINTGVVTVGLMGSEQHTFNYTVFGREVNLASRLEGISGRGRILIGESTYRALLRDDPALAATCQELAPTTPKGFRTPVKIFEVPWRTTTAPAPSSSTTTVENDRVKAAS